MKRILLCVLLFPVIAVTVSAQFPTFHQFYGMAGCIGGATAPDGSRVSASIDGTEVASTTTSGGGYGFDPLFFVENANDGDQIDFYVGDSFASTYLFQAEVTTNLDLYYLCPEPDDDDDDGPSGRHYSAPTTPPTTYAPPPPTPPLPPPPTPPDNATPPLPPQDNQTPDVKQLFILVEGQLEDGKSFTVKVVDDNQIPIPGAVARYGDQTKITGMDGTTTLVAKESVGIITAEKSGYGQATREVTVSPSITPDVYDDDQDPMYLFMLLFVLGIAGLIALVLSKKIPRSVRFLSSQ